MAQLPPADRNAVMDWLHRRRATLADLRRGTAEVLAMGREFIPTMEAMATEAPTAALRENFAECAAALIANSYTLAGLNAGICLEQLWCGDAASTSESPNVD